MWNRSKKREGLTDTECSIGKCCFPTNKSYIPDPYVFGFFFFTSLFTLGKTKQQTFDGPFTGRSILVPTDHFFGDRTVKRRIVYGHTVGAGTRLGPSVPFAQT